MSKVSPQQFGKYVLLRRIALGGMAEIFKAKVAGAEGFERDLVIKRILPHFTDDETFVQMFIDEARITAKLQHPNIVQIFDFDVIDDSYFIAMEYIEGKDLKDLIEESARQNDPLSVAQSVAIAIDIAKGLHYAHTREINGQALNIVHRDVTPSNVMISYRGDVKLMDFGIAKATQRSTKTQAGAVKGKVAYMSPEQARGRPIDGRSDVFALGVLFWEMLTGVRLFLAESDFDTLNNVLKMEAPPPSSLNAAVPTDLDPLVLKCLAKDPAQRWANADVLTRELTRWYYQNVTDIESEKLKPLMYRVFKRDIDRAEQQQHEDDAYMTGGAMPHNAESTAMHVPGRGGTGPVSEQPTRIGASVSQDGGTRPGQKARDSLTGQSVVTYTASASLPPPVEARASSSKLPLILLLVLLLAGGAIAVLLVLKEPSGPKTAGGTATSGEATHATTSAGTTTNAGATTASAADAGASEPPKEVATLHIDVDPAGAKLHVDGNLADVEVKDLALGQKVRIVAEAPGYKRFEDIISIDKAAMTYAIKMEREGVPIHVVIRPAGDKDEVFVDDKRLGVGPQPFEGIVDQPIVIKVVAADGGAGTTKVVKLDASMSIIDLVTPGELTIALDPADASITASAGTVEVKSAGVVALKNLTIGSTVTIEAKAKDRKPFKQDIKIAQPTATLTIALEKIAPTKQLSDLVNGDGTKPPDNGTKPPNNGTKPPDNGTKPPDNGTKPPDNGTKPPPIGGNGSIMVSARPWAQVMVNGRRYGTTPTTVKELPAGHYTVILTKGMQSVTKTVNVAAGQQANVFVDFTDM